MPGLLCLLPAPWRTRAFHRRPCAQRKCPFGDVSLLVPKLSRWSWHPFSISHSTPATDAGPGTLTLCIKREGTWTKVIPRGRGARHGMCRLCVGRGARQHNPPPPPLQLCNPRSHVQT